MQTVSQLFDTLGRAAIRSRLGHGHQVLSRATTENVMPAHWYFGIKTLCDERGVECPPSLFRTRHKATDQQGAA